MSKIFGRFIPAPMKGLNFSQPLFDGNSDYALMNTNMVCRPDGLTPMRGYNNPITVGSDPFKTLWVRPGVPDTLWVSRNSGIYPITSLNTLGALAIALTQGRGSWLNTATAAGTYTFFFNGTDSPKIYDGAVWAAAAITGPVSPNDFNQAHVFRQRMYLLEDDRLGFWYLAPSAIAGAATFYDMGTIATRGGSAIALGSFSTDNADGPNDYLAVYTSKGELVLFDGNDPGASSWSPIGVFYVGLPASGTNPNKEALCKFGNDLLVYTFAGVRSAKTTLAKGLLGPPFSYNIDPSLVSFITVPSATYKLHFLQSRKLFVVGANSLIYYMDLETLGWGNTENVLSQTDRLGNAVSFAEIETATGIQTCFITTGGLNFYVFHTAAITSVPLEVATWFSRLSDFNPKVVLQVRPWVYSTVAFNYIPGISYESSSNYRTSAVSTTNGWKGCRTFSGFYDDDGNAFMSNPWITFPINPGDSASLFWSASISVAIQGTKFLGWDLRHEQAGVGGP